MFKGIAPHSQIISVLIAIHLSTIAVTISAVAMGPAALMPFRRDAVADLVTRSNMSSVDTEGTQHHSHRYEHENEGSLDGSHFVLEEGSVEMRLQRGEDMF